MTSLSPEWAKTLFDHIEISKNLHHIKKVVLFDHLDCGAYKTFCPGFIPILTPAKTKPSKLTSYPLSFM